MAKKKNNNNPQTELAETEITEQQSTATEETRERNGLVAFFQNRTNLYVVFGLALSCLVIYGQTFGFSFINLDDNIYIYENPYVVNGLSFESVRLAFTDFYFANWHPLTTISYQINVSLFGFKAGQFHLVNVIFHTLNSVLLFVVIKKLTGSTWRSAVVATIFAVHPTHAESVAWISQRKDVLCVFFWLWSTYFYVDFARSKDEKRTKFYLFALLFFVCGLMSKSMAITLPFTFLLLDYWALERFDNFQLKNIMPLLKEKIPFFALTVLFSVITFLAQKSENAVQSLELLPISTRLFNAFISYVKYLGMLFYPFNLGVLYPYQRELPLWQIAGSIVLIIAISAFCIWQIKSKKYLFTGWFWFLGTLVPVIGILQVGSQSLADRYTYIPYIGLSLAIVWLVSDLLKNLDRRVLAGLAAVVLLGLAGLAVRQVSFWKNSETLYTQTLSVTENNSVIEQNLCQQLLSEDRLTEAEEQCNRAILHNPEFANAYLSLGLINLRNKQYVDSEKTFGKAIALRPNDFAANSNLTKALFAQGKFDEAAQITEKIASFANTGRIGAEVLLQNYSAIGIGYAQKAEYEKAADYMQKALKIDDSKNDIRANLGFILARTGKINEGINELNEAVRRNPTKPEFYNLLGVVLLADEKVDEAIKQFEKAVQLNPKFKEASDNLMKAKAKKK